MAGGNLPLLIERGVLEVLSVFSLFSVLSVLSDFGFLRGELDLSFSFLGFVGFLEPFGVETLSISAYLSFCCFSSSSLSCSISLAILSLSSITSLLSFLNEL